MIEFRLSDFFDPGPLLKTWLLLRRSEHWAQDSFAGYQAARLSRLLRACGSEVPYYRRVFQDAGWNPAEINPGNAFQRWRQLPVLDKNTLREHTEQFVSECAGRYRPKRIETSGTTGTPLTVLWDKGSNVMELCSTQRVWRWAGVRPGQPFLDLRSRIFDDRQKGLRRDGAARYIRNWKANYIEFNADLIGRHNLADYYRVLSRYRPRLVRGHPQAIQHLATLLEDSGLRSWRPHAVTTASEQLHDFQRRDIERIWKAPVMDTYGLKEHNVFIAQCSAGGYHVFPEYGICEILNDSGRPVGPGEEGWIVATGLHNFAQPLLRYNTLDRAVAGDGSSCPCGRTLPTIRRLVGRIDDCLYAADGRRFSGMSFAFFGIKGLRKARLVQDRFERVSVALVVGNEFNNAESCRLMAALRDKVDGQMQFDLHFVEDIVPDSGSKYKFVVSRLRPSLRPTMRSFHS